MHNNSIYNREIINEINTGYLIGKLATKSNSLPLIGCECSPITIMKNSHNTIVTYIKPLCDDPNYVVKHINPLIPCSNVYINLDYHNTSIYNYDYNNLNVEDKIKINRKIFENKIVVFKPTLSIDGDKIHKNMSIIKIIDNYSLDLNSKYISIPIIQCNIDEFEFKLYKEDKIPINDGVQACCQNDFVLCENRLYGVFNNWYKSFGTAHSWMCEGKANVTYIDLDVNDKTFKNNVLIINDEVAFISESYLNELDNQLLKNGDSINFNRFSDDYYKHQNNTKSSNCTKKESPKQSNIETFTSSYINTSSELVFLNNFKDISKAKGLSYDYEDLVNFHISLKTSPLTIIAGMTGTGKTQIAKTYADLLDINQYNKKLLFLPISPSYTEPEDILGFLNTNTGIYTPAETGLVDLLVSAEKDTNSIYMVIFDEMNLSQIEHWFAPFLSLLELPVEDRILSLYSDGQVCHNSYQYPSKINIPENVLLVGTVNLDETTKDFSDRVLDRANVLYLSKKKFLDVYFEEENKFDLSQSKSKFDTITFATYSSWIKNSKGIKGFNENEVLFLDSLDEFLTSEDSQKGISFRMINKISSYLENIPETFDGSLIINRQDAFDLILLQRLLPKLRGTERQLDGILSSNNGAGTSPLYELFDSDFAKTISCFTKTKTKIKEKETCLDKYGYTD